MQIVLKDIPGATSYELTGIRKHMNTAQMTAAENFPEAPMSDRKLCLKRFTNLRDLLLAVTLPLFLCSLGHAQTTIYSQTFNGGATSLNQTAPTTAVPFAGGASSAIWRDTLQLNQPTNVLDANGSWTGLDGDSATLPFTPENGYVYTLTVSMTFSGYPGSWIGAGFVQNYAYVPVATPAATDGRFTAGSQNGINWAIFTASTGNLQWFGGPATSNTIGTITAIVPAASYKQHTMVFTLDTTGAQWKATCSMDGKAAVTSLTNSSGVYTYATNPTITAVGLTQGILTAAAYKDIVWNSISLTATGTQTTNSVTAAVSFANTGQPLNSSFVGLSYEKQSVTNGQFTATNTPLINLFGLISPAVLRIGGGTSDQIAWKGISVGSAPAVAPMTPAIADTFTGFMKALPPGWTTIYGLNLPYNTPANAADEATYVSNDLGSSLLGFEIGNEPEAYDPVVANYLAAWQPLEAAVSAVPGWDKGTGTGGWMIDGPDEGNSSQTDFTTFTQPFSTAESGIASLLTTHFYIGTTETMQGVLAYPNTTLNNLANNIANAAKGNQALGSRITEAGTISAGGTLGISNAFGSALWALDFMLTSAQYGVQGVNFHGGGKSPYSPIINDPTTFQVTSVGPEFYAMKMFSMIPKGGSVVPATVTLTPSTPAANFSAYGIQSTSGPTTAVLVNKEVNDAVTANLNLGSTVSYVELISLTAPSLFEANSYTSTGTPIITLGGAPITTNGTWSGGVEQVIAVSNGQLSVIVPPTTAYLLIPTTTAPPTAPVTFSEPAGTYTSVQTVSLADVTPGSTIFYTTDGSTPTTSSTVYSGPITVGTTETINAIATATNYANSPVSSATYTIHILPLAATPTFSPASGTYVTVQTVSIADASTGVAIYYTTDGSTPTSNSTLYTGPITVPVNETINAIAIAKTANTYAPSLVGSAAYVINLPPPAFTITDANTTLMASRNGSATTTLTITANAAFNGTVTLGCSWYLPIGANCQFNPTTVSVNALGTTTTTLTITVPPVVGFRRDPSPMLPTTVLAGVLCLFGFRKRRRLQMLLFIVVSAVGLSMVSGCSSPSSSPGSSQFFITGAGLSTAVNAPVGAAATAVPESLAMTLSVQ